MTPVPTGPGSYGSQALRLRRDLTEVCVEFAAGMLYLAEKAAWTIAAQRSAASSHRAGAAYRG